MLGVMFQPRDLWMGPVFEFGRALLDAVLGLSFALSRLHMQQLLGGVSETEVRLREIVGIRSVPEQFNRSRFDRARWVRLCSEAPPIESLVDVRLSSLAEDPIARVLEVVSA